MKQDGTDAEYIPQLDQANVRLDGSEVFTPTGGLFSATQFWVTNYIDFAYKLDPYQSNLKGNQLPKWMHSNKYDIQARATGNPTKDQYRLMIQALLADRFKLALHWETRQVPVFALMLDRPGKTGLRLQPHSEDEPCGPPLYSSHTPPTIAGGFPNSCGAPIWWETSGHFHYGGRSMTLPYIAGVMQVGGTGFEWRPVLDKTGLSGKFDFVLEWTPQNEVSSNPNVAPPDPNGPIFLEALKDQLGLKLVPQTGSVDVLIIDHIEEPTPN